MARGKVPIVKTGRIGPHANKTPRIPQLHPAVETNKKKNTRDITQGGSPEVLVRTWIILAFTVPVG